LVFIGVRNPSTSPKQADVLIENCSVPQSINKTAKAIYRVEGKSFTIAANEPGDEAVPSSSARN